LRKRGNELHKTKKDTQLLCKGDSGRQSLRGLKKKTKGVPKVEIKTKESPRAKCYRGDNVLGITCAADETPIIALEVWGGKKGVVRSYIEYDFHQESRVVGPGKNNENVER